MKKKGLAFCAAVLAISGVLLIIIGAYQISLFSDNSPDGYSLTYGDTEWKEFYLPKRGDSDDIADSKLFFTFIIILGVLSIAFSIGIGVVSSKANDDSYNNETNTYNSDFWAKNSASKKLEEAIDSSCWHCPKCNRVNASYVGTCGCGERKPVPNANNTVVTETAQSTATSQVTTQAVSKTISSTDNQQTTVTESQDTAKPHVKNFCPYCGEKVIERQVYCSICGEKLK